MKKTLAVLLALLMVAVMSPAVFAADTTVSAVGGNITTITSDGVVTMPVINVILPTSQALKINPYNVQGTQQLVSLPMNITNQSDVQIKVLLTANKVTLPRNVDGVANTASIKRDGTAAKRQIFLAVESMVGTAGLLASSTDLGAINKAFGYKDESSNGLGGRDMDAAVATKYRSAKGGNILSGTTALTTPYNLCTVDDAGAAKTYLDLATLSYDADGNFSSVTALGSKPTLAFRYVGLMSISDTDPWQAADSIKIAPTFKLAINMAE